MFACDLVISIALARLSLELRNSPLSAGPRCPPCRAPIFSNFREKKVIFTVSPINCELPGLVTVTSTVLYRYARFAVDRSEKDKPEGNSVGLGQGLGQPQQKAQLRAT